MQKAFLPPQPAALSAQTAALVSGKSTAGRNGEGIKDSARKAANEFEAMFLNKYLESMFSGVKTDGPFGGGHGEKVYRSMLIGEYSKSIAASGGLGIADSVYREILALQEQNQK